MINAPEYNKRNVLSLKALTEWTSYEEQQHLLHNRILQEGFLNRSAKDVISDAKIVCEEWITDFCCPSPKAGLILNIAKEIVINYKIGEENLDQTSHEIYNFLFTKNPKLLNEIEEATTKILRASLNTNLSVEKLEVLAKEQLIASNKRLERKGLAPLEITQERLSAAKRLLIDIEQRKIQNTVINDILSPQKQNYEASLKLVRKDKFNFKQNKDYSFLGAAGSGKSTIARQWLSDEQKTNYIMLATDIYRAFTLPGTESHEKKATEDVFTRTQDMAYIVKEMVLNELTKDLTAQKDRPNIICDCITLEPQMRALLKGNEVTSAVAAYRGEPGYIGIAERADLRAKDENAAPADKGRYANTTALLKGHALASARLFSIIPQDVTTIIYDTNVERGTPAVKIGTIYASENKIEINDLRVMSEFLNKRNINVEAINQVDLILNNDSSTFITHPEKKAKAVLDLVRESKSTIVLLDKNESPYAKLKISNGTVTLEILNQKTFYQKSEANTIEAPILRALSRQIILGNEEKSFNVTLEKGDIPSFKECSTYLDNTIYDARLRDNKEILGEHTKKIAKESLLSTPVIS